ncbi:hypothetical protein SLEP1_g32425 [Rubroshorea leprosula]|uniref:Uncharacterized protein n=1 Tax=Rubroshorea leprosula TaxID=152421 RepID=A0AAV5KD85_9ROSI|nr:hypothetical protein SLEP1_g32425 [Rubroshorea leprosula]
METLKVRFLNDLLRRRDENGAERYAEVMTGMMKRARNCYAESLVISNEEFLEMMVLDGCFIVELIHKFDDGSYQTDPILNVPQITKNILKDLALVENQLPFFVLWELFGEMTEDPSPYIFIILKMFERVMPGLRISETYDENSMKNLKHLIDLLRTNWLPSEDSMREYQKVQEDGGWSFIRSATELREAGIKFKRSNRCNLFDLKFEKGTLYIPALNIEDDTERLFRNIIACEQFDHRGSPIYLSQYRKVVDCLINTGKDVELLCHKGIIMNWLGTDEEVAEMINRLGTEVLISSKHFFYAKLFNDVNNHYNRPWNRRIASLRHNYFNTPWTLISFLAAAFLLLLALLQTTFTIFPVLKVPETIFMEGTTWISR